MLAAIGVMAVTAILAFAMAGSTEMNYRRAGNAWGEAQEDILVRSSIDFALHRYREGRLNPDQQPLTFNIYTDHILRKYVDAKVYMREIGPEHEIYRRSNLRPRAGDALVEVESEALRQRFGRAHRVMLCNLSGQRARPIDVSRILRIK